MNSQYCTFTIGPSLFGIPVSLVQEVLNHQPITHVPLAASAISGLINLRGQIVTAIELRRRLGLPDRPSESSSMSVLLGTQEGGVGLVVDRIEEVLTVDDQIVEAPPETLRSETRRFILGAAKLKGRLLLILDAERVIDPADIGGGAENAPAG